MGTVQDSYNIITLSSRSYNMPLVFNIPTAWRVERVRVLSAHFLSLLKPIPVTQFNPITLLLEYPQFRDHSCFSAN